MSQTFSKGDTVRVLDGDSGQFAPVGSIGEVDDPEWGTTGWRYAGVKFDPPVKRTDGHGTARRQVINKDALKRVYTDSLGEVLEVGDRVAVESAQPLDVEVSDQGEVVRFDPGAPYPVRVSIDGERAGSVPLREDEVTKVVDEPAFTEGDRIVYTGNLYGFDKPALGTVKGITKREDEFPRASNTAGDLYSVDFDDSTWGSLNAWEDDMRLVEPEDEAEFAEGDRVMLTCGCHDGRVTTVEAFVRRTASGHEYYRVVDLDGTISAFRLEDATEATKTVGVEFDVPAVKAERVQGALDQLRTWHEPA